MAQGQRVKREVTAREWLMWMALGLVMWIGGLTTETLVVAGLGLTLAVVAAFGIAWRLLANR
jgi:hypothetical protein